MFIFSFLKWWYGAGWVGVLKATARRITVVADTFSVSMLLRTLFSPWRRIITYPGASLGEHLRAFGDNLISRFVGFFARVAVLFSAAVFLLCLVVLGLAELIIWPVVPIAAVALTVKGFL